MTIGEDVDVFAKETFPILDVFSHGLEIEHEDVRKAGAFLARAALREISDAGASHIQQIHGPA